MTVHCLQVTFAFSAHHLVRILVVRSPARCYRLLRHWVMLWRRSHRFVTTLSDRMLWGGTAPVISATAHRSVVVIQIEWTIVQWMCFATAHSTMVVQFLSAIESLATIFEPLDKGISVVVRLYHIPCIIIVVIEVVAHLCRVKVTVVVLSLPLPVERCIRVDSDGILT